MEEAGSLIAGIYLAVMAVIDRKQKAIPIIPGVACIIFIALAQIVAGKKLEEWLPGILVGIFLFVVSRLSRGEIGQGDALVYIVSGLALGFYRTLKLLMLSLFLAAMAGLALLVIRRVGRKYTMPFVPFTAIAYGVVFIL